MNIIRLLKIISLSGKVVLVAVLLTFLSIETYAQDSGIVNISGPVYDPESRLYFQITDNDAREVGIVMSCEEKIGMMSYPELSGKIEIPSCVRIADEEFAVTSIRAKAFSGNSGITHIYLPESIREVGEYAFYSAALREITVPPTVEKIETGCFQYCKNLERLEWLRADDFNIPEKAFAESGLKEVKLGRGVSSIGDYSFGGLSRLEVITIGSNVPPELLGLPFYRSELSFVSLFVPADSEKSYNESEQWASLGFMEIVPIENIILPDNISLSADKSEISVGESLRLYARLSPPGVTDQRLVWTSSAPELLEVDKEGVIKGISPGYAVIRVSAKVDPSVFAEQPFVVVSSDINAIMTPSGSSETVCYINGSLNFSGFPPQTIIRLLRMDGTLFKELTADDSGCVSAVVPEDIYILETTQRGLATLSVYKILAK